jgi:hypothetical protein
MKSRTSLGHFVRESVRASHPGFAREIVEASSRPGFVGGAGHYRRASRCSRQEIVMSPTNQQVANHAFLTGMYKDAYFPDHLVDKGKAILLRLCERIEAERPADLTALYVLTHAATDEFNDLNEEFAAAGSDIETAAREWIAEDFWFVASAYGFEDADWEELISTRDW